MPVLAAGQMTLLDAAKRLDPKGRVLTLAELLSQQNDVLEDIPFIEGNLPTGHRVGMRTGLPEVYWRLANAGVPTSKSTSATVDEACAVMEARSYIDTLVAQLNGNRAEFRLSEETPFVESMNQRMTQTLFNGSIAAEPASFPGLSTRYSLGQGSNPVSGQNVLLAGGGANGAALGADNTSIYLIGWSPETVFGIYPKGSSAGLTHQDLGEEAVRDANGREYQALRTLFQWQCGLALKDWRYVVRIANLDVSDLLAGTGTQTAAAATNVIRMMSRALDRIPNFNMGRFAFYMNRSVYSALRLQAMDRTQNVLAIDSGLNQFGTAAKWLSFQGVPLRKVDALGINEAGVPF